MQQYDAFMEALRRTSPVPIEIKPLDKSLDGLFSNATQSITVREGMSEIQTVCATVHEIAHAVLHNREKERLISDAGNTDKEPPKPKDENTMEVEAESVSFAVCQYYGIDTSENSLGYIAGWSKDRSLPELKASLETITKTVNGLISGIDKHFAEICKERGIDLTAQQPEPEADMPTATSDTPEQFAADLYDFMDQLHPTGILEHPWTLDTRERSIADLVSDMQTGYFGGIRDSLAYLIKHNDLVKAGMMMERMNALSSELESWEQASKHYVTDFFMYLNELHEAGKIPDPLFQGSQTKTERIFLSYMREGEFNSFRRILEDAEQNAGMPLAALRNRLETLSDRWDSMLICKIEPKFGPDTADQHSIIQTYEQRDSKTIPGKVVFSGSLAECQRVVAGLEAGTLTLRQVRQPDFEPPAAPEQKDEPVKSSEPEYVYKMEVKTGAENTEYTHFIQAYEKMENGKLKPEQILFVGKADMCIRLLDGLKDGTIQRSDFTFVRESENSNYATRDGAKMLAFVGMDEGE